MPSPAEIRRNKQKAAIHAAKRDLGMDDDTYRDMLEIQGGARSCKNMGDASLRKVLDHLRQLGWKAKPRKQVAQHPGTPHNLDHEPLLQKIEAQLADMGLPWSYADAIARQQTGIARVAWLRKLEDLRGVVAALKIEQDKRGLLTEVEKQLAALGWSHEDLVKEMPTLPKNWQRKPRTLTALVSMLDGLLNEVSQ